MGEIAGPEDGRPRSSAAPGLPGRGKAPPPAAAQGRLRWLASLRGRQLVLVVVAFLPLLLMALYINHELGRRQVDEAKEQVLRLAQFVGQEQRTLLASTRRLLAALAEIPAIATAEPEACEALFRRLIETDPVYQNFAVVDAQGRGLCGAAPRTRLASGVGQAWFERIQDGGDFVVGDYDIGRATGKPTLVTAVALRDEAGDLQRAVLASLSLAWLGELLNAISLPPATRVLMLDSQGVVLAHVPGDLALVGRPLPASALATLVLAAREGTIEQPDAYGSPHLYGFTAVDDSGVHVLVERPRASALASVHQAAGQLLLYLAGATIVILIGVFAAGRIFLLRPVEALAGAAARLAGGDLTARTGLAPYRDDELGRLAHAFDDMAEQLKSRQEELETRGVRAEARFLDAIESVPHAFILWDAADRMVLCNRRYRELFPALTPYLQPGVAFPELARASAVAGHIAGTVGREEEWLAARMGRRRRLGEPFEWLLADGRWLEVREYRTAEGGVLGIFTDVTERHAAEAALQESRERLRAALAAAETGTWRWNFADHSVDGDENLARLFGLPPEPAVRGIREFGRAVHPDDRERVAAAGRLCVRAGADFDIEFRVRWSDGSERWLASKGRTVSDAGGVPRYNTGACIDITRHKRLERQQNLLLAELSHRVKNTLATVQSIAQQTLRHAPSAEAFADTFTGRLGALADAHSLLTRSGWESANLRALAEQALRPYRRPDSSKVALDGPDLTLTPKACLALSLVLHELTTNAAKYGALSVAAGRVEVRWWLEDGPGAPRLRLRWRESGGPKVEPPARRGFGTRLIERSLAYELDGEAELTYAAAGVVCTIAVPWTDEADAARTPKGAAPG